MPAHILLRSRGSDPWSPGPLFCGCAEARGLTPFAQAREDCMRRRKFLRLAGAALAVGVSRHSARAQSWPDRAIKLIVPYAPGGATDLIARPWADKLSQAFGQQFVVENRGGASGMIGVEAASKAPPDGYTLLLTPNNPLTILPSLRKM